MCLWHRQYFLMDGTTWTRDMGCFEVSIVVPGVSREESCRYRSLRDISPGFKSTVNETIHHSSTYGIATGILCLTFFERIYFPPKGTNAYAVGIG